MNALQQKKELVQVFESLDELGSDWEVIRHFWTDDRIELAKIVAQFEDGGELRAAVRLASVQAEERSSPLSFESIMLSMMQPSRVYLSTLAKGSRRTMSAALESLAALISEGLGWPPVSAHELPWHLLRFNHTQAAATALSQRHAPGTVRKMLAALRGVLKAAWKLGQMTAEDFHRACEIKLPRAGRPLLSGRALEYEEFGELFAALAQDTKPVARRDAALLALLFVTGLRRSEVVALTLADLDTNRRTVTVRHGKGNKAREVPLADTAWPLVETWLAIRGNEPGALFCPQASPMEPDRFAPRHLTDQAVYVIMRRLSQRAGVAKFSPHDLRRSAATHMIEAGQNLAAVSATLGHSSINQTGRYDRSGEKAMRRAVNVLQVPALAGK